MTANPRTANKPLNLSLIKPGLTLIVFFFTLFAMVSALAQPNQTEQQKAFLQGLKDIKYGNRNAVSQTKLALQDHSLLPYFLYQDTIQNLDNTPEIAITQFVQRYSHLTLASRLEQQWIKYLGEKQQWSSLLNYPHPASLPHDLTCYIWQAKLHQQQNTLDISAFQNLWLSQTKLTPSCQPIEQFLLQQQHLKPELIWKKIERAFEQNQTNHIKQLATYLPEQYQSAVTTWLAFHDSPASLLAQTPDLPQTELNHKILLHSLKRLAQREPLLATEFLTNQTPSLNLNLDERMQIQRIAGLRLAYRYDEQAKDLLDQINQNSGDHDTLRWQAQIALRQSDWSLLLQTISLMPLEEQQRPKWRYWTARALQMSQNSALSEPIYRELAKQRNYYGFLAADHLQLPYPLQATQTQPSPPQSLENLHQKYPALALIEQLIAIDWHTNANREWQHLIQTAAPEDLESIATLANSWQQHHLAIRALAQGQQWDLLEMRFPTPYKEPVMQNAEKNNIDAAWIYGVMRRESAFASDARSPAGAIGLMQILPSTAKYVGRQLGLSRQQYRNLTHAQSNIELGSAYLRYLLEKYHGNLVMATAAYNAGPRRVDSWTPQDHFLPADQWIDSIPFQETRKYVKSVLEYTMVFQSLLHNRYNRLAPIMPPIGQPLHANAQQP